MTKPRKKEPRLPTRERTERAGESITHLPVTLEDYDGASPDERTAPDLHTEMDDYADLVDPGEPARDPQPLDKLIR